MRDAVAEVLVERERIGQSTVAGYAASFVFHGAVVAFVLLSGRSAPDLEKPMVITMRLMNPSSASSAAGRSPAESRAARATPTPKPRPTAAPQPSAKPGKIDPARSAEKTLFGKAQPPPAKAATPAPAAPSPGTTGKAGTAAGAGATPAIGTAGVSALEGGDFPYSYYIERMLTLIGQHWFRPQAQGEPLTRVYFVIDRNGSVRDVKIESGSGSALFDRAAYRAVIETSPLPPLPFQYSGNYLGVHLTFH